MRWQLSTACVLVVCPFVASQPNDDRVETLLPADTIAYFRFDGIHQRREALAKTVLGEFMQEDLGDFFGEIGALWKRLLIQQATAAVNPEQRKALQLLSDPAKILSYLERHGGVVGAELLTISPLRWQINIIFPNGGLAKNRKTVFSMLNLAAKSISVNRPKSMKKRGRNIFELRTRPIGEVKPLPMLMIQIPKDKDADPEKETIYAWWQEGNHVVFTIGTESVDRTLDLFDGKRPNFTSNTVLKTVTGFDSYTDIARGFIDLRKIMALLATPEPSKDLKKRLRDAFARRLFIRRLGLNGIRNLTVHWGCQGRFLRSTTIVDRVPRDKRRGLLRIVGPIKYEPAKWPRLPPDASYVDVRKIDWNAVYDVGLLFAKVAEYIEQRDKGKAFAKLPTEFEKVVNKNLGFDLRPELLDSLDGEIIIYKARSEGPIFLGYSLAAKVRDTKQLERTLNNLTLQLKKLAKDQGGFELKVRKHTYRRAEIVTFLVRNVPVAPSFTIHKGWLVAAFSAQAVKAYVLRSTGKRQSWRPPAYLDKTVAEVVKNGNGQTRILSVSSDDPRPMLERILPLVPLFAQYLDMEGEIRFDATKIPHTKAVTELLFPNVTVCFDDGDAIRWERYASLEMPSIGSLILFGGLLELF